MHRHYAPSCRVILVTPSALRSRTPAGLSAPGAGLLHRGPAPARRPAFALRVRGGVDAYAAGLFAALRAAEAAGVKTLYVETVPARGVGLAVMDRLRRAARRR
jgi:L-threonylcarbamoyladenylate synthase